MAVPSNKGHVQMLLFSQSQPQLLHSSRGAGPKKKRKHTPDNPVHLHTSRGVRVNGIPGGLCGSKHSHRFCCLQSVGVLHKVLAVEYAAAEGLLAVKVRHEGLRSQPRGNDEAARKDLGLALLRVGDCQDPAALGRVLVLRHEDLGLEADQVCDPELGRILLEIGIDDRAGNVFVGLDPERGGVHGEVGVLIRPQEVVALQIRVHAMVGPCAAQRRLRLEHSQGCLWMRAVILLCGSQAVPSCRELLISMCRFSNFLCFVLSFLLFFF